MLITTVVYPANRDHPTITVDRRRFGSEALARRYIQRHVDPLSPQHMRGSARRTLDIALDAFRSTRRTHVRAAAAIANHESFSVTVTA